MAEEKTRKRRGFFKRLLSITLVAMFAYIRKKMIEEINHKETQEYLSNRLTDMDKVREVLTDADPDDQQQLQTLWVNELKPDLEEDTIAYARAILSEKIKDKASKEAILAIIDSIDQ